ncbi:hypothetical protein [Microbacterium sp. gxy059]|uniref:hypothetical protein n=1 Tax=Microbacterium sp. gxy059 TaxID=2957199 RepID=UPI003D99F488
MVTQTDIGHGRGWLTPEAAASIRRLDAVKGAPWQITEAGRTWDRQKQHWDAYQAYLSGRGPWAAIALHPDAPSIHQRGSAIDTDQRETALLNEHGWFHTVYRDGVLVEPWHYEYDKARDKHLGQSAGGGGATTTPEEDIMNASQEKKLDDALRYAKAAYEASRQSASTTKWIKARIKGSVNGKSLTALLNEAIGLGKWLKLRIKGSYKGDSITKMLRDLGDRQGLKFTASMAVDPDPVYEEIDEPAEPIPDEA